MKSRFVRTRTTIVLAIVVAASLGLASCSAWAEPEADENQLASPFPAAIMKRLDAALADAMALSGSSGALAGVWAPWAGEWVASPGTTTTTGGTPLTPDMRFRIGTNTTAMTCTVLLRLVDEGRVKLDDLVSTYLTRTADVDGITLGQLCRNTSGLADYYQGLAPQFVANPTRQWPPMEILSSGMAGRRVSGPGGAWSQSSTGIVLLGMALRSATHQNWQSLYRQYIFDPLGLRDTSFPASSEFDIPGPHPHGYAVAVDKRGRMFCEQLRDETELSNSMGWVASGVVSTLADMKTWSQALATGSLLSGESADAQWESVPQGVAAPSWQRYGLGGEQLGPLRGHAGAIPGFISASLVDPDTGLTVVVMLNNSSAGSAFAQDLAQRLASIASNAPALDAMEAPTMRLPWTEEEASEAMRSGAVCQAPVMAAG